MDKVYIIEGWFGSDEWIEGVYSDRDVANLKCNDLWKSRRSEVMAEDDFKQGFCKFGVVDYEVM